MESVCPTFTFEALADQAPQHLSTVVAEGGGLVGVDVEGMGSDLEVFNRRLGYGKEEKVGLLTENTQIK